MAALAESAPGRFEWAGASPTGLYLLRVRAEETPGRALGTATLRLVRL